MTSSVIPVVIANGNVNFNFNVFIFSKNFNFNVDSPGMLSDEQLVFVIFSLCCCMDIPLQETEMDINLLYLS